MCWNRVFIKEHVIRIQKSEWPFFSTKYQYIIIYSKYGVRFWYESSANLLVLLFQFRTFAKNQTTNSYLFKVFGISLLWIQFNLLDNQNIQIASDVAKVPHENEQILNALSLTNKYRIYQHTNATLTLSMWMWMWLWRWIPFRWNGLNAVEHSKRIKPIFLKNG